MRRVGAAGLALTLFIAACSGGDDDDSTDAPDATATETETTGAPTTTTSVPEVTLDAAALCNAAPPAQIGALANTDINELSGLEATVEDDGDLTFVAHNDSGDSARLFAFNAADPGLVTDIEGAGALDWEDMTESADAFYFGDIGDNFKLRPRLQIYKVVKPPGTAPVAETFEVTYPGGAAYDAETLMVDEPSGELVIVTKEAAGNSTVYTIPIDTSGELTPVATLALGDGQLVTAGDISADGHVIVLRTYSHVWAWDRAEGESLADAFAKQPCPAPAPGEPQGEAITVLADGYVTISEGVGAAIWRVTAAAPA